MLVLVFHKSRHELLKLVFSTNDYDSSTRSNHSVPNCVSGEQPKPKLVISQRKRRRLGWQRHNQATRQQRSKPRRAVTPSDSATTHKDNQCDGKWLQTKLSTSSSSSSGRDSISSRCRLMCPITHYQSRMKSVVHVRQFLFISSRRLIIFPNQEYTPAFHSSILVLESFYNWAPFNYLSPLACTAKTIYCNFLQYFSHQTFASVRAPTFTKCLATQLFRVREGN